MLKLKKMPLLLAAALFCVVAAGCNGTVEGGDTSGETDPAPIQNTESESESEAQVESEPETEAESESEKETTVTLPNEAELLENPVSDITGFSGDPDGDAAEETAAPAETDVEETPEDARIYDYLNGKTVTEEERNRRPVAIMINNIKKCLPQDNITAGDMYYECAAEGGITRIMMLTSNYDKLGVVGSVRSSRDYFVDFLANHDAIYVHAGGSEMAYDKILWRGIDNLDGVNMYLPNMFYRDSYRMNNMGYEHSLMTTGENIVAGIA